MSKVKMRSRVAQAMHFIDGNTGGVVPPLHTSTTFARNADYETVAGYTYGRYDNPTVSQVESILCELDGGEDALCFASGLGAFSALFETVKSGAHIAIPRIMYHGGLDWLLTISKKRNIGLSFYNPGDLDSLRDAVQPGKTAIVWVETPSNPTWDITDIAGAAEIAHQAGAVLGVDSTCAPPTTTKALSYGADVVFHSATKYLNGHSDITAGVLVTARKDDLWQEVWTNRKSLGSIIGNFEAWLLIRGLRTLFVRFDAACKNAIQIAQHFENHPMVDQVLYPGLASHPGHELAAKQMTGGFGGMLSLLVKADEAGARQITSNLKLFIPATSLGGAESLAEHRKTVEGPNSAVPDNLIRFSVGIEDAGDLIGDIEQALGSV